MHDGQLFDDQPYAEQDPSLDLSAAALIDALGEDGKRRIADVAVRLARQAGYARAMPPHVRRAELELIREMTRPARRGVRAHLLAGAILGAGLSNVVLVAGGGESTVVLLLTALFLVVGAWASGVAIGAADGSLPDGRTVPVLLSAAGRVRQGARPGLRSVQ